MASQENDGETTTEGISFKRLHFDLSNIRNSCFLAALKQHFNTWRKKIPFYRGTRYKPKAENHHQHNQQTQPREKKQSHCLQNQNHHLHGKWLRRISCNELNFTTGTTKTTSNLLMQQPSVGCKTKFFEKVSNNQFSTSTTVRDCKEGPSRQYGRKVQIVASLLSLDLIHSSKKANISTLEDDNSSITRSTSLDSGCFSIATSSIASEQAESVQEIVNHQEISTSEKANTKVDKMTIFDDSYSEVRREYPDFDTEIRSILTARAQNGATISDIREDYRDLTGGVFPDCDCITDILLSVPNVTAYCDENGTRIFNIRPSPKTKHIYDMVMNQKRQQATGRISNYRTHFTRYRNPNLNPYKWPSSSNSSNQKTQEENSRNRQQQQVEKQQRNAENEEPNEEPGTSKKRRTVVCSDMGVILETTEEYWEHNTCFDGNCKNGQRRCDQGNNIKVPIINPPEVHPWPDNEPQQQRDIVALEKESLANNNTESNTRNNNHLTSYDNNIHHLNSVLHKGNVNNTGYRAKGVSASCSPPDYASRSPTVQSQSTNDSNIDDYGAHLLDFLLLGDDFLMYMARMELKCKFKKEQRILESGLCASGQTIAAAYRRIRNLNISGRSVIVNIGSVNILHGRQLIQIEHEYRELITLMMKKGIKPILTTLAPLANYTHFEEVKLKLERFNEFIKREGKRLKLVVIDIWQCLLNEKGHVLFDCFQNEPRSVTGAREHYLFWNKIGRQRVLKLIESHLEY